MELYYQIALHFLREVVAKRRSIRTAFFLENSKKLFYALLITQITKMITQIFLYF